jgi:hypothetical protein
MQRRTKMKKANVILAVALLASSAAMAGFSGYSTGEFYAPDDATATQLTYLSGDGTNHLETGKPVLFIGSKTELTYKDGYEFYGEFCDPFKLGKLTFQNGLTCPGTQIEAVSLDITTTITSPEYLQGTQDVDFDFDFRAFKDGLVMDDSDLVFDLDDCYSIEILGFKDYCGDGFKDSMYVCEGSTSCDYIWAKICRTECPAIPAPGAVILAGIGTSIVGWLRRRKDQ